MDFYSKKNRCSFEHWIDIISVFGVVFLFFNCVLYALSKLPIHLFFGLLGIVFMALRMIKWYDD